MTTILERPAISFERLGPILAQSASAPDRTESTAFVPAGPDTDAAGLWLSRAAGPHAEDLRHYLTDTGRDVARALRSVRWVPEAQQPSWVRALITFLVAQPDDEHTAGPQFARRAAASLLTVADVSDQARADLDETLVVRLSEALARVEPATDRAGWLALLESAPGLAYVIGITCAQWADAADEMFERLSADRALLRTEFWHGSDAGAIVGIRADAGDRHAGGRSVALIDFAHGPSLVYKSKDLSHVAAFQSLLGFLDSDLRTRRVLLRPGYGWEERVLQAPCDDETGFTRFYRRLGRLSRVMQLVAGRDMWADNLLACGEHPVVIDLECVLFATARPLPGFNADPSAIEELNASVVATSMVLQPWSDSLKMPVLDVGCLSRASDVRRADGSDLLPLPPYRPYTDADLADPWAYGTEVLAGYQEMQETLVAKRAELVEVLAAFRDAPVRHIRRNTWDCYRLVRISVGPEALAGGVEREIVLAGLMRSVFEIAGIDRPDLIEMVLSEIAALRGLDIPLFGSRPGTDTVFDAHGTELGQHFDGTAWGQLVDRVNSLADFDFSYQSGILGACIDASRDGAETSPVRRSAVGQSSTGELVQAATEIGDMLLQLRRSSGDWIAQTWHPVTGLRNVEVVGSDLASGTCGFAVLLAELTAVTGAERFGQTSVDVLDAAAELAHAMPGGPAHQRISGPAYVPGGLAGTGAVIHALARAGQRLNDKSLALEAVSLVPQVTTMLADIPRGERRPFTDAPTGVAGLLANLHRLRETTGTNPTVDAAITQVLAGLDDPDPRFASRANRIVPAGIDSVAMVRARLGQDVTGHLFGSTVGSHLARYDVTGASPQWSGDLSGIDLLQAIHSSDPEPSRRYAAELLARHARFGRWFPDRFTDDRLNLNALDGLTAIGLALLHAAYPDIHSVNVLR
jgi:hypothetical protein